MRTTSIEKVVSKPITRNSSAPKAIIGFVSPHLAPEGWRLRSVQQLFFTVASLIAFREATSLESLIPLTWFQAAGRLAQYRNALLRRGVADRLQSAVVS